VNAHQQELERKIKPLAKQKAKADKLKHPFS
jgi:hypothetical protein